MMATTSQLAEKVRVAVACFRATEKPGVKVYVLLEATDSQDPKQAARPGVTRLLARRVYAGEHKNVEGKWTVVVGHDLAEPTPTSVSVPISSRSFEVSVRATAWGAVDVPFEGVFDLRSVEIEK